MEEKFEEILFKYRWYLVAASSGILLILFGILSITRQLPWEESKVEILGTEESSEVVVEIGGAVERPGVYKFPTGARVEDLLITAGGLSVRVDRDWVARVLNRAAKLTDGQKVYIPKVGESIKGTTGTKGIKSSASSEGSSGLININSASQAELEALPGIGPVTAKKIIEGRPYSGVEELLTRKILKKNVYEENKDKLSVY